MEPEVNIALHVILNFVLQHFTTRYFVKAHLHRITSKTYSNVCDVEHSKWGKGTNYAKKNKLV